MRKQLPINGEKRIVRKFSLFPITCNSQEWAWMEWVNVEQMYYGGIWIPEEWHNIRFVDGNLSKDRLT